MNTYSAVIAWNNVCSKCAARSGPSLSSFCIWKVPLGVGPFQAKGIQKVTLPFRLNRAHYVAAARP